LKVAQSITDQWNQIIKAYDERGDSVAPILEIYQRLRGVYVPNEQKNYLTKIRPIGLTLMAIIFASSIAAVCWVFYMRSAPVVRSSQPPFLLLISFGCVIMGSSIIAMGIDDEVASFRGASMACMATPWLVSLGFTVCFAALFSKILRLKTLMRHAANFRRIQVTVWDVLAPFCVMMTLNVAFLLTWTIVDPLYWERVDLGRTGDGLRESYGRCTNAGTISPIMAGLIGAVNLVALLLANIEAYQTRELSVAFNESKFVGLAIASILQAMLIGLPLLFLADTNTTARYLVRCILVFVVCMSVMVFIFLPKFLRGTKKDEAPGRISSSRVSGNWQQALNTAISKDPIELNDFSTDYQKRTSGVRFSGVDDDVSGGFRPHTISKESSAADSEYFGEDKSGHFGEDKTAHVGEDKTAHFEEDKSEQFDTTPAESAIPCVSKPIGSLRVNMAGVESIVEEESADLADPEEPSNELG
jgi:hypothetical protein